MAVLVEREDGVAVVTVDRPDALNALDLPTLTELRERLLELRGDEAVRVVVLTGAGERAFIAGADIKYMSGLDVAGAQAWGELGHNCAQLLETMPKPTVAAVNAFALGGGCELALACDLRYAARTAKFGQPEVNLAVIPGWGGTQRLARVCGIGEAKDMILTGRVIDAEEALRIGLVNGVYEPGELMERVGETARAMAAKSPLALAAAKAAVNQALQGDHVENLVGEAGRFAGLFASEDQKEGMAAFIDKREARFTSR
jgi:enoyl-CoA hydratase